MGSEVGCRGRRRSDSAVSDGVADVEMSAHRDRRVGLRADGKKVTSDRGEPFHSRFCGFSFFFSTARRKTGEIIFSVPSGREVWWQRRAGIGIGGPGLSRAMRRG